MSTYDRPTRFDPSLFVPGGQSDVAAFASAHAIEKELEIMLQSTREIFGDDFRVVVEEDVEIPDDLCLVFEVKTRGDIDEVLAKEDEWHRRCARLAWELGRFFRLCVDIG